MSAVEEGFCDNTNLSALDDPVYVESFLSDSVRIFFFSIRTKAKGRKVTVKCVVLAT